MKKTPRMLEVEDSIDESLEDYLSRRYVSERNSTSELGKELGVTHKTVIGWLDIFGIPIRTYSTALLQKDIVRPSKEELESYHLRKGKSVRWISRKLGVSHRTIGRWFREDGIEVNNYSREKRRRDIAKTLTKERLEELYVGQGESLSRIAKRYHVSISLVLNRMDRYGIKRRDPNPNFSPKEEITKEKLEQWYVDERRTLTELADLIGYSDPSSARRLLAKHNIPLRGQSEAMLSAGAQKPTKEKLKELYLEKNKTMREIASEIGCGRSTVQQWLAEYGIIKTIRTSGQFIRFLRQDEAARNLASAAVLLNGQAIGIEQIIAELYKDKFRDQGHLHDLLEQSEEEIYSLIAEGITNLGAYLGDFTLADRKIMPLLIGDAIAYIPEDRVTPSLEDRLVSLLRVNYSPQFNDSPQETLTQIWRKMSSARNEREKSLYKRLWNHYHGAIQIGEELE